MALEREIECRARQPIRMRRAQDVEVPLRQEITNDSFSIGGRKPRAIHQSIDRSADAVEIGRMASPYLYSTPIAEQTLRQGTPMASGAGQLCEAPREGCGLPEARLLQPRQSDLRRIHIPAVKDALRSVHRQVYHCPVSVQFDESAAGDGPQQTGATEIVEGPLGRTTE